MELDLSKSLNAVCITSHTLVGTINDGKYPYKHGNCFSMKDDTGKEYRIINFNHENMHEAIKRGVSYPIKILPLGDRVAIIADSRIPDDWYADKFCSVCTPRHLLSIPQRLKLELSIERGETTFRDLTMPNGDVVTVERSMLGKHPDLRTPEEIKAYEDRRLEFLSRFKFGDDIVVSHGIDIEKALKEAIEEEVIDDMVTDIEKVVIENKSYCTCDCHRQGFMGSMDCDCCTIHDVVYLDRDGNLLETGANIIATKSIEAWRKRRKENFIEM